MNNLPFHRKYRPQTFDEIIGNKTTINSIKSKVKDKNITTYIFTGERGTGKTTTARIVAKELGAKEQNRIEMDIADIGLKDKARQLKENVRYKAFGGGCKVYIFDECQDASKGFWQAMLKTLEEPPKDVYFILCTTDPQKLPKAILSRCSDYHFEALDENETKELLSIVNENESNFEFSDEIFAEIYNKTEGIPREALVLFEKIYNIEDDDEIFNIIKNHIAIGNASEEAIELCRALIKKKKWNEIAKILKSLKDEPEQVRYAVLGYANAVLLNSGSADAAMIIENFKDNFFYSGKAGLTLACYLSLD